MVVAPVLLALDLAVLLIVDDTPAPRATVAQRDDAPAFFSRRAAFGVGEHQSFDASFEDLTRDRRAPGDGRDRHVHPALLVGQDEKLLERHQRLPWPIGAERPVVDLGEDLGIHAV